MFTVPSNLAALIAKAGQGAAATAAPVASLAVNKPVAAAPVAAAPAVALPSNLAALAAARAAAATPAAAAPAAAPSSFALPSNLAALAAARAAPPVAAPAAAAPAAAAPAAAAPAAAAPVATPAAQPTQLDLVNAARAVAPAPGSTNFVLDSIAKTLSDRAASASQPAYYYIPGATGSFSSANAPAGANLVRLSPYMSDADKQLLASANTATIAGKSFADPKLQDVVAINRAVQAPSPLAGLPGTFSVQDAPLYDRYPTAGLDTKTLEFAKDYKGGQYLPFMTNQGMSATYQPEKLDPYRTSGVYLDPNAQYRITDRASGEVLYTGTGEEGLKNTFALSQKLSAEQGNDANWGVEMYDPNSKAWTLSAEDNPNKSALGDVLKIALPIAVQFIPGIGQALGFGLKGALGAGVAAGTGAALARTGAGIISGDSVLDSLKAGLTTGALSGLTAGAFNATGLDKAVGSAFGDVSAATSSVPAWVTEAAATPLVGSGLGSTFGSTLGSAAGSALSDAGITVLGNVAKSGLGSALGAGAGSLVGSAFTPALSEALGNYAANSTANLPNPNDIVVEAAPKIGSSLNTGSLVGSAFTPEIANALEKYALNATDALPNPNDIVVEAAPKIEKSLGVGPLVGSAFTPEIANALAADAASMTPTDSASTLDKVVKYLRLAGLGTALFGDLFGGGGKTSGSGATIPKGFGGGLSDVFSSTTLPAPNMPGLGTNAGARTAADLASRGLSSNVDYYRYGYGPEQSFFNYVPQGARNTSTAYTGYAEGGEVHDTDLAELGAQSFSAGNSRRKRKPSFHGGFNVNDDGLETNYSLAVPLGDATFGVDAYGSGIVPDVYNLRGQYDLGDASLRASHMLGGGSEYGISAPLFGGDFDVSAYAPQGFVPEGIRASYRRRFEEGGYAVGGPGDGREDKIPAMLSDGEYVMDAETVAMLGNGSSKAGAEALDKFRVNIRKHKGRGLAKGNFSVNAKKPEQYLKRKTA